MDGLGMHDELAPVRAWEVVQALERTWFELQRRITGLPAAVVIPFDSQRRRKLWGHFDACSWPGRDGTKTVHEIAVSPELFGRPDVVLETLVHEAAHALVYAEHPEAGE